MKKAEIGIIGGSGLYEMEGFSLKETVSLETPWGSPSDAYRIGELAGRQVAFLPRHGAGHRFAPHEINYRANIFGFKLLGVERLLGVSAVGSMKEAIAPGDVVVIDQFIDRTRTRPSTFFENGIVAHIGFAHPICPDTAGVLTRSAGAESVTVHEGGTYVCIDGPQFSTLAESKLYRSWGVSVIGMTNIPEAKLAREAEICYATLALATDYDCWHETAEAVTVEGVLAILKQNVENAQAILHRAVEQLPASRETCNCGTALDDAMLTQEDAISEARRSALRPLLKRLEESRKNEG